MLYFSASGTGFELKMYESHFGLTGSPFRLVPDPSFYFDSRTHANALAYLKFGVFQAEGFIVVTGEVGAGKTMLVRTLLGELSEQEVVAAHVVTTRLDPEDLLRAALVAFGIAPSGQSKAHLLSTLEGFLTAVAANGKRALLVVDEAQNLSHAAIEELRMLSNFQIGDRPLLQSFLVGQPELRRLVQDPTLEQFRQRIIASCHLGPLSAEETRSYIEHRLKHAGWAGRPYFAGGAYDAIHRCTAGIPRRINLLCNRLLLSAFLRKSDMIEVEDVEQTANDLRAELGSLGTELEDAPTAVTPVAAPPAEAQPAQAPVAASPTPAMPALPDVTGALLCLVDSDWSYALSGLVCQALAECRGGPAPIMVHLGGAPGFRLASLLEMDAHDLPPEVYLHLPAGDSPRRVAQLSSGFLELLERLRPQALITAGATDEILSCAMVARREGVPIVRLEAGTWGLEGSCQDSGTAAVIDRVASVRYASSTLALRALRTEGLPDEGTVCVGSLTAALLHLVSSDAAVPPGERGWLVLVTAQPSELAGRKAGREEWRESLKQLGQRAALLSQMGQPCDVVWMLKGTEWDRMRRSGEDRRMRDAGLQLVKAHDYLDELRWLSRCDCLVATAASPLREEAAAMQLPIAHVPVGPRSATGTAVASPGAFTAYVVSMLGTRARKPVDVAAERAASRIAEHLQALVSPEARKLIEASSQRGAA